MRCMGWVAFCGICPTIHMFKSEDIGNASSILLAKHETTKLLALFCQGSPKLRQVRRVISSYRRVVKFFTLTLQFTLRRARMVSSERQLDDGLSLECFQKAALTRHLLRRRRDQTAYAQVARCETTYHKPSCRPTKAQLLPPKDLAQVPHTPDIRVEGSCSAWKQKCHWGKSLLKLYTRNIICRFNKDEQEQYDKLSARSLQKLAHFLPEKKTRELQRKRKRTQRNYSYYNIS